VITNPERCLGRTVSQFPCRSVKAPRMSSVGMSQDRCAVMYRRNSAILYLDKSAGMFPVCNASLRRRGFPDKIVSRYLLQSVMLS